MALPDCHALLAGGVISVLLSLPAGCSGPSELQIEICRQVALDEIDLVELVFFRPGGFLEHPSGTELSDVDLDGTDDIVWPIARTPDKPYPRVIRPDVGGFAAGDHVQARMFLGSVAYESQRITFPDLGTLFLCTDDGSSSSSSGGSTSTSGGSSSGGTSSGASSSSGSSGGTTTSSSTSGGSTTSSSTSGGSTTSSSTSGGSSTSSSTSGGSSGCSGAVCAPVQLADEPGSQFGIAADATHLYWAAAAGVRRVVKGGTSPTTFASAGGTTVGTVGVAVDSTHVYWTTTKGSVWRKAKSGGAAELIDDTNTTLTHIVVDDTHVYWSNDLQSSFEGEIRRWPKAGGSVQTIAQGQASPHFLAVDSTHVYWANTWGDEIVRYSKTGGAVITFTTTGPSPNWVALDSTHVYWTTWIGDTIDRKPKVGGVTELVADHQVNAFAVVLDQDWVYWSAAEDGKIVRAPKILGSTSDLALDMWLPKGLLLDGPDLYVITSGNDLLWRIDLCGC